ncbi:sugar fermentation stimulation protein [Desulfoscipio gibsoniae DSM 7213]|uniref:Sugar fermentation stimulation protein n=1 Tax=Desulfoscipio gibsoniae DSM 7213 TaxID=767817 RepID=R4KT82_9FIRM|nr:sugar fermentation stimulation protein [Desulfoscipio gibsoniae DSM 7213]
MALVNLSGREVAVHVPSTGRMKELLVPGATVYLSPSSGATRRTKFTLLLVKHNDILVSVDSLIPNRLFNHAIIKGALPEFNGFTTVRREFPYRDGRIDFWLGADLNQCLVEVKSVTLVENGKALFPDAPSKRGPGISKNLRWLGTRGSGQRLFLLYKVKTQLVLGPMIFVIRFLGRLCAEPGVMMSRFMLWAAG